MSIFLLLALLLLIVVSGVYVFCVACVRSKELPWLDRDTLCKTPYGRFYDHIAAADQWLKDHNAQELTMINRDGLELRALWVPADDPKGTMLLVHGYRSCFLVDFGLAFERYHSIGMNLLLPYQRSHGKSQGRFITFGVRESEDILEWIQLHNERFGKYPMIVSGLSMGASTVLYLADRILPRNVRGLIADCGFTSPREILSHVYKRITHLPPVISLWVTDLIARIVAGFSLSQKDTRQSLGASNLPVLFIHGEDDDFVPCSMTLDAYRACVSAKQLLTVKGAGHGVSYLKAPKEYGELVERFINENMEIGA